MRAKCFPKAGAAIAGSEITAGSLRGRAFEALTITSTDQSAISCIKLKGGVHVWTPGGPLTMQHHTHTHTHLPLHCICLMNEHQLWKKDFYKLAPLQLQSGPRSNWLCSSPTRPTLFCLFSQFTANQTSLFSIDTSICLTPKQQMSHIWQVPSIPFG